MNQPFILFSGPTYYPGGGWGDYAGAYCTLEEALNAAAKEHVDRGHDWWQVVDLRTLKVVKQSNYPEW